MFSSVLCKNNKRTLSIVTSQYTIIGTLVSLVCIFTYNYLYANTNEKLCIVLAIDVYLPLLCLGMDTNLQSGHKSSGRQRMPCSGCHAVLVPWRGFFCFKLLMTFQKCLACRITQGKIWSTESFLVDFHGRLSLSPKCFGCIPGMNGCFVATLTPLIGEPLCSCWQICILNEVWWVFCSKGSGEGILNVFCGQSHFMCMVQDKYSFSPLFNITIKSSCHLSVYWLSAFWLHIQRKVDTFVSMNLGKTSTKPGLGLWFSAPFAYSCVIIWVSLCLLLN